VLDWLKKVFSHTAFPVISFALFVAGFVLIVLYVTSQSGPHLGYCGVGLLTALAAFLSGTLAGLLVGVPRYVSSGEFRFKGGPGHSEDSGAQAKFEPSSNLAEVSDWLTKLLLGAGLVELSRFGRPLSELIDAVARGISGTPPTRKATEAAVIIAATILIAYGVLGFLDGYVTTNVWYGKRIDEKRLAPDGRRGSVLSVTDEIEKLAELHASGKLTDEEFAAKKKQLLGL
jgi:hypothetical protein